MMQPLFLFNNTNTHVRWLSSHDTIDTYAVVVLATFVCLITLYAGERIINW